MSDTMNPVKIYSARDRVEADMLVQALINQDIPAYRQGAAGGDYMDIYMGNSVYGENIYVDEKDQDAAMEIIESIVAPVEQEEDEAYGEEDQLRRRRPIVVRVIAVVVIVALVVLLIWSLF